MATPSPPTPVHSGSSPTHTLDPLTHAPMLGARREIVPTPFDWGFSFVTLANGDYLTGTPTRRSGTPKCCKGIYKRQLLIFKHLKRG